MTTIAHLEPHENKHPEPKDTDIQDLHSSDRLPHVVLSHSISIYGVAYEFHQNECHSTTHSICHYLKNQTHPIRGTWHFCSFLQSICEAKVNCGFQSICMALFAYLSRREVQYHRRTTLLSCNSTATSLFTHIPFPIEGKVKIYQTSIESNRQGHMQELNKLSMDIQFPLRDKELLFEYEIGCIVEQRNWPSYWHADGWPEYPWPKRKHAYLGQWASFPVHHLPSKVVECWCRPGNVQRWIEYIGQVVCEIVVTNWQAGCSSNLSITTSTQHILICPQKVLCINRWNPYWFYFSNAHCHHCAADKMMWYKDMDKTNKSIFFNVNLEMSPSLTFANPSLC